MKDEKDIEELEYRDNIPDENPELDVPSDEKEESVMDELRSAVNEREKTAEAIRKFTDEEEGEDDKEDLSLRYILGGDVLGSPFFIKQVAFVIFVVFLMLVYTGNRYDSQQDIIFIDSLRKELQDMKYNVMTQSSELLNLTRQSNIERRLKAQGDSALTNPITPPYLIRKSGVEEKPLIIETETDPNLPTGDEV